MNSLHKIVEDGVFLPGDWSERAGFLTAEIARMTDGVKCFDIGDAGSIFDLKCDGDDVYFPRLPFQKCWFEFHAVDERTGAKLLKQAVLMERRDTAPLCYFFHWSKSRAAWSCIAQYRGVAGDSILIETCFDGVNADDPSQCHETQVHTLQNLGIVGKFLKMLACVNVDQIEQVPDRALQKARVRKGKIPMFSTWVCVLKGKSARGEWMGGTHASPRLHFRRGHIRKGNIWVRECMVGNKELGLVEKTYARKKGAPPSAQAGR